MENLGLRTENFPHRDTSFAGRFSRFGGWLFLLSPLILGVVFFALELSLGSRQATSSAFSRAIHDLFVVLLGFILVAGLIRMIQMIVSVVQIRVYSLSQQLGQGWLLPYSLRVPPISLIVWVHNEAGTITERMERLLKLEYPTFELVVVNDGSTDATQQILQSSFDLHPVNKVICRTLPTRTDGNVYTSALYPNLTVVDKPWSGRGDSLNFALNLTQYPLVLAEDSDTILQSRALVRLAKGFIEDHTNTVAVSSLAALTGDINLEIPDSEIGLGRNQDSSESPDVPVVESSSIARYAPTVSIFGATFAEEDLSTWIQNLQRVDRMSAFHSSWLARNWLGSVPVSGGIPRLLRKSDVVAAGGYDPMSEEVSFNLLLHIQYQDKRKLPRRVVFLSDILARIEVPEDLNVIGQAQRNWQRLAFRSLITHWKLIFKSHGDFWWRSLSYPVFFLIDILGPVIELIGFGLVFVMGVLGIIDPSEMMFFIFAMMTFALVQSIGAVLSEEFSSRSIRKPGRLLKLILVASTHAIGYRQMSAYWKLRGIIDYALGKGTY